MIGKGRRMGRMIGALAVAAVGTMAFAGAIYAQQLKRAVQGPPAAPVSRPAGPRPPTTYGVVLTTREEWSLERSFANLALGGHWMSAKPSGWSPMDKGQIAPDGSLRRLNPDEKGVLTLTAPPASYEGPVPIRCTFLGKGQVDAFNGADAFPGRNRLDFTWKKREPASLLVTTLDASDPVRGFDCRERSLPRDIMFDPGFIATNKVFSVVRFLDWERANDNVPVTWATRTQPNAVPQDGPDGVAIEHLVALANALGASPWFCIPYNADEDYVRHFADYVHAHLDPKLVAYVETGNEIWNFAFPVSAQVLREGRARKLSADDNEARMRRYAQHATEFADIWAKTFADNPKRVARVLAGQSAWADLTRLALEYKDTPRHFDAVAIAPYFGLELLTRPNAPLGDDAALFTQLDKDLDGSLEDVRRNRALADRFGLRLITYEAGQHIIYTGPDKAIVGRLNRDPRMKRAYERYLAGWSKEAGDLITMFASVSQIGPSSAWGLQERSGQPLSETPKRQAVLEAIERTGRR